MIKIYNSKTQAIMEMEMEEYLKGVVAFEMPALFELGALKAQAVVSRSYALRRLKKGSTEDHPDAPLCTDSKHCQGWYSNQELRDKWGTDFDKYMARISEAVNATKAQIVYYKDKVIDAVFHSTCGGRTETAENVWGNEIAYLKSVECDYCKESPHYRSTQEVSTKDLRERLGLTELNLFDIDRNENQRAEKVSAEGKTYSGTEFRSKVGLKSTWFTPVIDKVVFQMKGFGHGVGMCQWGADGQAKEGKGYQAIVEYYYTDATVKEALAEDNKLMYGAQPSLITVLNARHGIFDEADDGKLRSRVVVDLSGPVEGFSANTLSDPDRLYVDIPKTKLGAINTDIKVDDGLVKTIRLGQFDETTVRVVLDLVKPAPYSVFTLGEDNSVNPPKPNRLVIDVVRDAAPTAAPTSAPTVAPKLLTGRHIVVDPGHGGYDSGAVGNGLREKNLTLDIAKKLQQLLVGAGAKVTMTRTTDTFVSLTERTRIANATNAEIFVSVHINSATSSSANGLETFHYPGSTNGKRLATAIQSELVEALGWRDRGVKTAYFYVLRYTDMIAALAENGFIVNPAEAKALSQSETRAKMARAIFEGIVAYFR